MPAMPMTSTTINRVLREATRCCRAHGVFLPGVTGSWQEIGGALLARALEQGLGALLDRVLVHHHHVVGHAAGEAQLMVTITSVVPERASSAITLSTSATSSGSSAEVGSSNSSTLRLQRQRAGDRDALLLATGQLAREGVGSVGQADPFQQRARLLLGLRARHTAYCDRRFDDVLQRGQVRGTG